MLWGPGGWLVARRTSVRSGPPPKPKPSQRAGLTNVPSATWSATPGSASAAVKVETTSSRIAELGCTLVQ